MLATTTKDGDQQPHAMIDPEIVLAARADRTAAEADRRSSQRPPDVPLPKIDPDYRTQATSDLAVTGERSTFATWAVRTILAVLFAVGSAVAAAAWQSYGDQAQEMIAHWMPRITLASNADKDAAAQPAATAPQQTAAEAPAEAQEHATSAVGATASQEQLLQSMAHDLAALSQQIGELKTSLAQLKAGQEQMVRDMARVAEAKPSDRPAERSSERTAEARSFDPRAIEQTIRPRPAPRPATAAVTPALPGAAAVHRPRTPPPAAAGMAPPPPAPMPLPSAPVDPDQPVVRPPMPVR
ncbi:MULTISPECIES: hypothetical protein [unclassified Bradyrhizobium]|uniref:hypothetical protein n=1 Tax=unclassified Bradyrhizobium TaxID=2631580 RepID=UPI0028E6AB48|nr:MULTISPECIES: hypothetical protein [unclassified Bradyrhizobium]